MIGTIELDRLAVRCIVGILPFERVTEQDIYLDVSMDLDFASAAASEDVVDTVNYASLAQSLSALVRDRKFQLIETMAESCASLVLGTHARVERVRVTVHKPAAVPEATDTRVRVDRSR
jgi:7,8-dihydroneopterin aldolase/epimerase/oxygenase